MKKVSDTFFGVLRGNAWVSYDCSVSINVIINGQQHTLQQPCTVKQVLHERGLGKAACAVEVNRRLVPKRSHPEHVLSEGDTIEIVTLVGGG